ncbi:MAG: DUF2339 domain-containing protein [Propionivibrio sp.]
MESLILLAGLFFIGGPILLFFLVIGARSRVRTLEDQVRELQWEVQQLSERPGAGPVAWKASVAATAGPETNDVTAREDDALQALDRQESAAPPPRAIPLKDLPRGTTLTVAPPPAVAEYAIGETGKPVDGLPGAYRYDETATTDSTPTDGAERFEMPSPPAWAVKARDWLFGGNLVAKAGLLILFFGVSFLIKYAAARVTLPIEFRLCGIVLADIALLVWGWRIRASRPAISLPVQGAALGILMLVTFGAYRMYDVIPGSLAFALLFVLTAFTCLLAILQDAVWLAVFGIVGGFAAPILTSTGQGSHIGLFSYYALLNAGILAIAIKRSWRLLNLLGFAFTFVIATAWGVLRYEAQDYASVQGFLILFLLFYVAISVFYALRQAPRLTHYVNGTLVFGTPLVAFGLQYGIVRDKPFGLAFSALAMGLFYVALTLGLWKRRGESLKLLVESFLALGIVFGTLAIPFALDGRWTSAAWALEGAGIVWVGLRQRQTLAWVFGVLVQIGAWISFMLSMFGLDLTSAMEANLWLGFLLLAVTGLVMAMNFRREVGKRAGDRDAALDEESEQADFAPRILTWLATGFLGFAALWLLAGAWTEIFLHGGAHTHTLLVISAMAVAGVLALIAARLDWSASRYFALVPQFAAGFVFLWLSFDAFDWLPAAHGDSLFDTSFLGGLLIALGAGVSSLAFARQLDARHRSISRMLLGWCGFWWFVHVLGSLDAWGGRLLASYNLYVDTAYPAVHPLYGLAVALSTPLFARLARRLDWPDLRWMASAVWVALLFVIVRMLERLNGFSPDLPMALAWITLLALWLAGEWLMRAGEHDGWLANEKLPTLLRTLHLQRTVGPWLLIWPFGTLVLPNVLGAGAVAHSPPLGADSYFAALDWTRYLTAWIMMGVIALLLPRVHAERWPTAPISAWYRQILIPVWVAACVALVVVWNLTQNGSMRPLPYLPILNPIDLTTGFVAILALSAYRLFSADDEQAQAIQRQAPTVGAVAAYLWFNLMLLRSAAQYLDIAYEFDSLFRSQVVQAMLSLVWSATALLLMRFAAGRRLRLPWMAGAGLLAVVVAKLFFIDLTNVGGVERIVSFLGVGVLMLAIGYLAPFPSESKTEKD